MSKAAVSSLSTSYGSRTDVGRIRDHNEDSLTVNPPLFAVADGMGGHAAGEVASEIAIQTLIERAPDHLDIEALGKAVQEANLEVISAAAEGLGRAGMGTTMTAAMIDGERIAVAQVGDSRVYLLHDGEIQQVTRDHSLMADLIEAGQITPEEARVHPQRSVITRALGSNPHMLPDLYEINAITGDRLLLCSDGLSSMIEDSQIESIMASEADPQECASLLVDAALEAGGHDNVTVIVVDIDGLVEQQQKKEARKTRFYAAFVCVLLVALLGGTAFAFNWWVNTTAYLIEQDGYVAVYTGIPEEIMGMSFNRFDHLTSIEVSKLNPTTAALLKEKGIKMDSLAEANEHVASLENQIRQGESEIPVSSGGTNDNANTNSAGNTNANANTNQGTSS